MKFFNFDKIKQAANCLDIAREIGLQLDGNNRTAATWRGGDNQTAVSINADGWHDFAAEESGSVIDLVALVMFDGDRQQAQQWLGDKLNLEPDLVPVAQLPGSSFYDKLIADGYRETVRHIYTDEVGNEAHYVARLEHPTKKKVFAQGANGRWGVKGIKLYPYNLPTVLASSYVWICEGEKAADALIQRNEPATTNVSGAGKWRNEYNEYFQGKSIAILRDNDDEGLKHALQVAKSLISVAKDVRILTTSDQPKGDVFDWFAESPNNTPGRLFEIAKGTPETTADDLESVEDIKEQTAEVSAAKEANRFPLSNYWLVKGTTATGKPTTNKEPKQINKLVEEIKTRFVGFPCKVGEQLFDHDRDTHEIYYLRNNNQFTSWMSRKSKQNIDWVKSSGFITREEMFEAMKAEARKFEAISQVPDWPRRSDVYYAHKPLPQASETHEYFNQFIDFFNPSSSANRTALKAFVMAPLFYIPGIPRPLWIIDSERPGSGKTMLANFVSQLYGKPPVEVKKKDFSRDMQEITKRLVSPEGRLSRMLLVDNVSGVFSSDELSGLITMPYVTGKPPYGHGEESRPNNLTYVITANDATIDNDLAIRAYFIELSTVNYSSTWNRSVQEFLSKHRYNVFADMLDILNKHDSSRFDVQPCTRCPEFEIDVLQAVCADLDEYTAALEAIAAGRQSANIEEEYGKEIEECFRYELQELGINPDAASVWVRSTVVNEWVQKTFPERRGNAMQFIRNLSKTVHTTRISCRWTSFPHHGSERRRGVLWLNESASEIVENIVVKHGRKIEHFRTGHTSESGL